MKSQNLELLEELKRDFTEWRKRKRYAKEQTPDELIARARDLADIFGIATVVRAVGINRSKLRQASNEKSPEMKAERAEVVRVAPVKIQNSAPSPAPDTPQPTLCLESADGTVIRVFQQFASSDLPAVIQSLRGACQ